MLTENQSLKTSIITDPVWYLKEFPNNRQTQIGILDSPVGPKHL